ncbi:branched-chain amino acid ABC transporter permease [Natronomonas marina]|jgi:branched-chain amino acid transport system permease protein|uniref:branched-chain amino acid ABC transporter permease n=1 Tax=Natronomonas marina TaxID=2961939 RepID=UPI0020C98774|nr:branched-chain amino acid ABC transporter permease [Natronomonas marina]
MATETPLEGDVDKRRREAVKEKLMFQDVSLRHRLGIYGIVLLGLLPTILQPSELLDFTYVLYLMMFAISWDVVSGYTGQLSFGHAFFFALGGYGTAVVTTQHSVFEITILNVLFGILVATLVAAIGGVLIGVPALRLDGPYLSLVTLIAPLLLYQSFILFSGGFPYLAPDGFGGTSGLVERPPQIVGLGSDAIITAQAAWTEALGRYYLSFVALLVVLAVTYAVTRSAAGSVFTAIREDEDAVRSVGLNPAKFKIFAFVLSAAVGGFAAAVWMHAGPSSYPNTESVFGAGRIDLSINVIVVAIIGGMGTIVGSVVGAMLVFFARLTTSTFVPSLSPLPTFLLGMLVLVFLPRGVVPELADAGKRYMARRRGEEPRGQTGRSASESTLAKYREEIEDILGRDNR